MTTPAVARIIDTARLQAPGALEGILRLEFFNALKEFLQRTDAWREDVTIPVQANWPTYELPAFSQALVNRLMWLEGQVNANPSGPPQYGPQRTGWLEQAGQIALLKIDPPSSNETWTAHIALTVCDPTDSEGLPSLPAWIVEKYHDYLASGVLARLCAHPGKPYSNQQIAMLHGRRFSEGVSLAKKEARQGHLFDGQRWGFPQTFASFSQKNR